MLPQVMVVKFIVRVKELTKKAIQFSRGIHSEDTSEVVPCHMKSKSGPRYPQRHRKRLSLGLHRKLGSKYGLSNKIVLAYYDRAGNDLPSLLEFSNRGHNEGIYYEAEN